MDALQVTKLPTFCPELGSSGTSHEFSSHNSASLSRPPLLQDTSFSAFGGHVCSPATPLPAVRIPHKWFEPNKDSRSFESALGSYKVHDLTSRRGSFEDGTVCDYDTPKPNIPETSRRGPLEDGNHMTLKHNIPDGRLKTKILEEQCHDTHALPTERDFIPLNTLHFLLDKCTMEKDIMAGRFVHSLIISSGFEFVPELGNNLIHLFGLCASLDEAELVFSKLVSPRVSSWYTLISAHAMHGDNAKAVQLYTRMVHARSAPNSFIFTCVINSCASLRALTRGEEVHNDIVHSGLHFDLFVASALIDFYSKCGSLSKAYNVFVMLPKKNVVVWSAMIGAFIQQGCLEQSLKLLREMGDEGIEPNEYTYSSLISACGNAANLVQGMGLHDQFTKSGLTLDSRMGSTLIDMYAKCGCLIEAHDVFDELPHPTSVCWNTLIAGYARNEDDLAALEVFESMESEGCSPDSSTLSCCIKACGNLQALDKARIIHDQVIMIGLESDEYIKSSLIDMYCKCGCLDEARGVFEHWPSKNIVLWGALMAGYVHHDHGLPALDLFAKMQKDGIKPNVYIYTCVLQACASLGALNIGVDVHEQIRKSGLEICGILGSSLIDMYAKCGNLEAAALVFEELPSRNVVCWGALLAGYVQHGHPLAAFGLYEKIVSEGTRPDRVIYMYILEACAITCSSGRGRAIHHQIIASGLGSDMVVGTSLVDMYVKCDCLEEAQNTFLSLEKRNKISWDAIIVAHSRSSEFTMARDCLRGMAEEGFVADEILFTDILAACRRSGNVEEGRKFFKMMRGVYGINPSIEHFGCMINLLGEGGQLLEAEELLDIMPISPDSVAWMSLLSACRAHKKVGLGFKCFNEVVRLDPGMGMAFVLMSSIFAEAGMWEKKHMIDEQRKQADIWKVPGKAWIEVNKEVHEFMVGDRSHPQSDKIYATLRRLATVLKDEGHVPQLGVVGGADDEAEMPENSNEEALLGHCEKLAIAFGLFSTPEGATVRVVKNLRVCVDCHNVSKIISKVEKREIIINDAYHVHHFNNGECSCEKNLGSG